MCLALYKPANIKPDWDALEEGMCHNSDGAGFAVAVDGQLIVEKGFFKFADFKKAFEPFGDYAAIVHFRLATHGGKNQQNCHPFALADFGNDTDHMPVAVIHNGIFSQAANDQKQWSDTWHVCRDILHPLWAKEEKSLVSPQMIPLGDSFVGSSNKLVFLYADGTFGIWGEKNGHWSEGVWYSNYSYCSYGARYADPRSKYVYDDDDAYWTGSWKSAAKKQDDFVPVIDYAVEATAVELALIEELRDLGYAEDEIERLYIQRSMPEEVASVYQLTVADVMACAKERADSEGFADADVGSDDLPDLDTLPDNYAYVGLGALRKTATKIDGSVLGWDTASGRWIRAVGILSNMHYAVRNEVKANKAAPKPKAPEGFVMLGKGPVHFIQGGKVGRGDILRWSDGYQQWSENPGLIPDSVYCARKDTPVYVSHGSKTVSALKLEEGRCYVTRDGRRTGPVTKLDTKSMFQYSATIAGDDSASTFTWMGCFASTSSSKDIIGVAPCVAIVVGRKYITRDGRITEPVEANPISQMYPLKAEVKGETLPISCTAEGKFMTNSDSKNDLVAEYDPNYELLTGDRRVYDGDEVLTSSGEWTKVKAAPSARMTAGRVLFRRRKTVNVGEGYRPVEPDELTQSGDEFYVAAAGKWMPTSMVGVAVGTLGGRLPYRRAIQTLTTV